MEIKPSPTTEQPPEPPLAEFAGFIQDDRHHFVTVGKNQFRVDRATPLGVAIEGLHTAGNSEHWQKALERGIREGVRIQEDTEEVAEAPSKPSLLTRLFGKKPKPPAQPAKATKMFIPNIPDYTGAAAALGIDAKALVANVRVNKTGVKVTMSDGKDIEADPKGALSRSVAVLLEELDAIGEPHPEARKVVNAPLGRPVFDMPRFGKNLEKIKKVDLAGNSVKAAHDPTSPAAAPAKPSPAADPEVGGVAAAFAEEAESRKAPPSPKDSASAAEEFPPEFLEEAESHPSDEESAAGSASTVSSEQPVEEKPAAPAEPEPIEPAAAAVSYPPGGGHPSQKSPSWSREQVRIGQRAKPKPGGPYTVEARSREMVEGKYQVLGQFNLSKEDYEVVQWLSKTRREAIFSVSLLAPTGEAPEQEIPQARIEGVSIKNETIFVPVNWKHCREEFELANTAQTPERRDAIKSAAVETAVATPLLPATVKASPAKPEDIKPGVLALPKLRPLKVPVAAPNIGPSLGR